MSYHLYTDKALEVAESARRLLNTGDGRPSELALHRAAVATDLAVVYARLADTAARVEASGRGDSKPDAPSGRDAGPQSADA